MDNPNLLRGRRKFLAIRRTRGRDRDRDTELAAARESFYYWWWAFLRETREYRSAVRGRCPRNMKALVKDFGRLGSNFDRWWLEFGRNIFAERFDRARVRKLEQGEPANYNGLLPKLVVELPLSRKRRSIIRQVNQLLDEYHAGARFEPLKFSMAQRKLYPKQRIRLTTFEPLMRVWQERMRHMRDPWWKTGERLGLSPIYRVEVTDDTDDIAHKRRMMTLTVQRQYRRAKALIDFAGKGDFPRFK